MTLRIAIRGYKLERCCSNSIRANSRNYVAVAGSSSPSPSTASQNVPTSDSCFGYYSVTSPPNPIQLKYASSYFTRSKPEFLFSVDVFRKFPSSETPEVAFLGRSNVGKSSLLNAIFNRSTAKMAYVSKRPGRTRTMNAYGIGGEGGGMQKKHDQAGNETLEPWIGKGGLVVVDMPGYGMGSKEEWGKEILKYLRMRKQLRRAFVLIDATHGIKATDEHILGLLRNNGVPHQIIVSKTDRLIGGTAKVLSAEKLRRGMKILNQTCENLRKQLSAQDISKAMLTGDILACSAESTLQSGQKLGIDEVRWAILQASGLDCNEYGHRRAIGINVLNDEE